MPPSATSESRFQKTLRLAVASCSSGRSPSRMRCTRRSASKISASSAGWGDVSEEQAAKRAGARRTVLQEHVERRPERAREDDCARGEARQQQSQSVRERQGGRTWVLRDDREPRAQVEKANLRDVQAVDDDFALARLNEAEEGLHHSALAAAGRADDANFLAGLDREVERVQDVGERVGVADREVLDLDVALRPVRRRAWLDDLGGLRAGCRGSGLDRDWVSQRREGDGPLARSRCTP